MKNIVTSMSKCKWSVVLTRGVRKENVPEVMILFMPEQVVLALSKQGEVGGQSAVKSLLSRIPFMLQLFGKQL